MNKKCVSFSQLQKTVETIRTALQRSAVPAGGILLWSGTADKIPSGWALCDGENGTPDLRNRFVVGAGTRAVGTTGGSESVVLTAAQMPSHSHTLYNDGEYINGGVSAIPWGISLPALNTSHSAKLGGGMFSTTTAGESKAHENMPPYYTLCYIMKL